MSELNSIQKYAVQCRDKRLQVLAGPGSGKTRIIAYKIKNLIESGMAPSRIISMTFTKKAAEALASRLSSIGSYPNDLFIGTIHSICYRLLQKYGQGPTKRIADAKTW